MMNSKEIIEMATKALGKRVEVFTHSDFIAIIVDISSDYLYDTDGPEETSDIFDNILDSVIKNTTPARRGNQPYRLTSDNIKIRLDWYTYDD